MPSGPLTTGSTARRTRLEEVETRIGQARQGTALDGLTGTADVRATWNTMGLDRRRAVLDLLAGVIVVPREHAGRLPGGGYFDPASVVIEWKAA